MHFLIIAILFVSMQLSAEETNGIVQFTPPDGWHFAEAQNKLKSVKTMVVGEGQYPLKPSISLGTEHFEGPLKDYLKIVKALSVTHGGDCKDLGMIKTEAGRAALLQEDTKTVWGDLRMMHVVLLKNNTVYILTAGALKDEFSKFYPEFFRALCSLRIDAKL